LDELRVGLDEGRAVEGHIKLQLRFSMLLL
jgi:hypothetical protein